MRTRYEAAPDKSKTLELLVKNEQGEKKRTATEGLLWLLRHVSRALSQRSTHPAHSGLNFTCQALKIALDNATDELSVCFTKSYEGTLKKFHSFVVRPIFAVAMKACPYRAVFFEKLGSPPEKVQEELAKWVHALDAIVKRLDAAYDAGRRGSAWVKVKPRHTLDLVVLAVE